MHAPDRRGFLSGIALSLSARHASALAGSTRQGGAGNGVDKASQPGAPVAENAVYLAPGAGARPRTVGDKLREIASVQDFHPEAESVVARLAGVTGSRGGLLFLSGYHRANDGGGGIPLGR